MKKISIINGPNLNLIGMRETNIYGKINFISFLNKIKKKYSCLKFFYYQSNYEGKIINFIHFNKKTDCIILNAGAYTHTSIAISDAIRSIKIPVLEVHISNIYKREFYRKKSFISPFCKGIICGFSLFSYELALLSFIKNFF